MDEIRIENLKIYAYHGVYQEEAERGQNFYVNAALRLSLQPAGLTDALERTISYASVCETIQRELQGRKRRLIEAAAEDLSTALFAEYRELRELELELRKPEAPIAADFESVSVRIRRRRHSAYIAYGANMGEPQRQIEEGIAALDHDPLCRVVTMSEMLETTPYGGVAKGNFYNGVLEVETLYEPWELLRRLHEIEAEQGRVRREKWGSRTLDLDIIFYDDLVMDSRELTIPHPDMLRRDFVLLPMAQIAPWYRHPLLGVTMEELAGRAVEQHVVK